MDDTPFRIRQYPLPVHATDAVDTEVDNMLASGIIRRSSSPYASPITVVMKKDNTIRLCIDFRKLNSITVFDAEPIPTLEELLSRLKGAKYFTKCDLTKGKIAKSTRHFKHQEDSWNLITCHSVYLQLPAHSKRP